jgi:cytidyltransferase-like protein
LSKQYKKGILFGVFDCFHEGHADFIRQAAERASSVIAVVARDEVVHELKNKYPAEPAEARLKKVRSHTGITDAVLGDREQGIYKIIETLAPDVIFLGYDQEWLETDLVAKMQAGLIATIPLVRVLAHKPEIYHTSILNT